MRPGILALAASLLALGCGQGETPEAEREPPAAIADVPAGWDTAERPLSGVASPHELLATASFDLSPLRDEVSFGGCGRPAALRLPGARRGALVIVSEYSPGSLGDRAFARLPRRPSDFDLTRRNRRTYECFGEAYNLHFREHGRALLVHVWMDPDLASERTHGQAERLLDSLRFPRL